MSDDQVKSIIERVQRLQEEKRTIEDDIKEVYAEARSNGYDVKVLRAVVKHLGKDQDEVAEFDAIFDLYLQSYLSAGKPSRAHVARDAGARTREATENSNTTTLGIQPSVQSEAEAGASPEEGLAARAAGVGGHSSAHADQFVTSSGEGEGAAMPADPSSAADEPIRGLAAANAIAARAVQPAAPKTERAEIDITIPALLRRTAPGNHPSFGEQA